MSKLLWGKSLNIIFTERLSFLYAVQLERSIIYFCPKNLNWTWKTSSCYCSWRQDVVGDWLGVSPAQGVEAGLRGRGLGPRRQQEVHHLPGELWLADTTDNWSLIGPPPVLDPARDRRLLPRRPPARAGARGPRVRGPGTSRYCWY